VFLFIGQFFHLEESFIPENARENRYYQSNCNLKAKCALINIKF